VIVSVSFSVLFSPPEVITQVLMAFPCCFYTKSVVWITWYWKGGTVKG